MIGEKGNWAAAVGLCAYKYNAAILEGPLELDRNVAHKVGRCDRERLKRDQKFRFFSIKMPGS